MIHESNFRSLDLLALDLPLDLPRDLPRDLHLDLALLLALVDLSHTYEE